MAEYISRDDALLHSEIIRVYSKDYGNIDVVPVEYLADIPTADVQSVKHGKFIAFTDKEKYETFKNEGIPFDGRCSTCNSCLFNTDKYCPNCGARMDAEPDEPWQSE